MKYYSDVTKKFYNDVKVLEADEAAVVKAEEERKAALVKKQEQQAKRILIFSSSFPAVISGSLLFS